MTDSDDNKSKQQLLEEIDALRRQLAAHQGDGGARAHKMSAEPSLAKPITRREALSNWITPVILSIPLTAAIGSGAAQAQVTPTLPPQPTPPQPTPRPPSTLLPQSIDTLGVGGAAVLGGALAAAGAKLLKDDKKESGQDDS